MSLSTIISPEDQYEVAKAKAEIAVRTQLAVVVCLYLGHFIREKFATAEGRA